MPEGPELHIMSDYINRIAKDQEYNILIVMDQKYSSLKPITFDKFTIQAESRGKEMRITLIPNEDEKEIYIMLTMGMSGHFINCIRDKDELPKHTKFYFSNEKQMLAFVDTRGFGSAKIGNGEWDKKRGPCPLTEQSLFKEHLLKCKNRKIFDKAIYLLMLDQKYFNGIGNYLRAEIINRWDKDFETPSREAVQDEKFISLVFEVCEKAYELGGASLYTWMNPIKEQNKDDWKNFITCYALPDSKSIEGPKGRKFWFR